MTYNFIIKKEILKINPLINKYINKFCCQWEKEYEKMIKLFSKVNSMLEEYSSTTGNKL